MTFTIPRRHHHGLAFPTTTITLRRRAVIDDHVAERSADAVVLSHEDSLKHNQMESTMPMKLNIGLSKKIGEPNYGSRGAVVNLELEVDSTLVAEPDRLQERIRELFSLAKVSIDEELHVVPTQSTANAQHSAGQAAPTPRQPHANGRNGTSRNPTNGYRSNGNGRQSANNPPPATTSQIRALHAISNRLGLNLEALLQDRFNLSDAATLTVAEASAMIDELNATSTATAGGRR